MITFGNFINNRSKYISENDTLSLKIITSSKNMRIGVEARESKKDSWQNVGDKFSGILVDKAISTRYYLSALDHLFLKRKFSEKLTKDSIHKHNRYYFDVSKMNVSALDFVINRIKLNGNKVKNNFTWLPYFIDLKLNKKKYKALPFENLYNKLNEDIIAFEESGGTLIT